MDRACPIAARRFDDMELVHADVDKVCSLQPNKMPTRSTHAGLELCVRRATDYGLHGVGSLDSPAIAYLRPRHSLDMTRVRLPCVA